MWGQPSAGEMCQLPDMCFNLPSRSLKAAQTCPWQHCPDAKHLPAAPTH